MGGKGAVCSIVAAVRCAKRRQCLLPIQQNKFEKIQQLEKTGYEVKVYVNHMEFIQSQHKEHSPPLRLTDLSGQIIIHKMNNMTFTKVKNFDVVDRVEL